MQKIQYVVEITPTSPACGSGHQGTVDFGFIFFAVPQILAVEVLSSGAVNPHWPEARSPSQPYQVETFTSGLTANVVATTTGLTVCLLGTMLSTVNVRVTIKLDPITGMAAGGSGGSLATLSDVELITPTNNNVLAYDTPSGSWINQTASQAGLATATHIHAEEVTGPVTSGMFETTDAYVVVEDGHVAEIVYKPGVIGSAQETKMTVGVLQGAAIEG